MKAGEMQVHQFRVGYDLNPSALKIHVRAKVRQTVLVYFRIYSLSAEPTPLQVSELLTKVCSTVPQS